MDRAAASALVLVLALPALLAGCLGGSSEEPEVQASDVDVKDVLPVTPEDAAAAVAEAPAWALGDAWSIVSGSGASDTSESFLVVTKAEADSYFLSTTNAGTAAYDAMEDVSYLGRIRASDLAGVQDGQPVQFFSFPLTDGKSWSTTWDGLPVTLTARYAPTLQTSAGIHSGFVIEGAVDGEKYVTYDYVPMLKWWSHLSFASGYGMKVVRTLSNWSGEYAVAEAGTLVDAPVGGTTPPFTALTVAEGQTFLDVTLTGRASANARSFGLVKPDGTPYNAPSIFLAMMEEPVSETVRVDEPAPGEWRVLHPIAHHPDGAFHLLARQVKVTNVAFP